MWLVATIWSRTAVRVYGLKWEYLFPLKASKGFVFDSYKIIRIYSTLRATDTKEPVAECGPSF